MSKMFVSKSRKWSTRVRPTVEQNARGAKSKVLVEPKSLVEQVAHLKISHGAGSSYDRVEFPANSYSG